MSEDSFDKKIRQKLESLEPSYKEDAWRKLKKAMPLPWYQQLLTNYGSWLYGALATVALLGTYFYFSNENKKLVSKLENANVVTDFKNIHDTIFVHSNRVDTVFVTKYIYKYLQNNTSSSKNQYLTLNDEVKKSNVAEVENKSIPEHELATNVTKNQRQTNQYSTKKNDKNTENAKVNNARVSDQSQDENLERPITPTVLENNIADAPKAAPSVEENILDKPKDSNLTNELLIPDKPLVEIDNKEEKSSFLKNLNFNLSLMKIFTNPTSNTIGPIFEFFINDRFSVGTGILLSKNKKSIYKQPKDFNQNTGKQFEDKFDIFIPNHSDKIDNISITSTFVKMPLFINYYMPIKKGFAFVINTGTKLDLVASDHVTFSSESQGVERRNDFDAKNKTKVFNNMYYGMGLQYQYQRFSGQLIPYFEYSFRNASDISSPQKYGLMASLKFSLKK